MKISAVIIAFNEESKIGRAVRSVGWADEILVIDSGSSDRTREIARGCGARVIERDWPGFAAQKQFGVDSASNDWILSIDADEEVSLELRDEIAQLQRIENHSHGYRIPRLSFYMGREIRHGGWFPDFQIRLFDRRYARWRKLEIHESVEVDGTVEEFRNVINHFSVDDAAHHHLMIGERYAPLAAQKMLREGRRTSPLRIAIAGFAAFVRAYIVKLGFLDGLAGYAIARFAAHHAFLKHLMLFELQKSAASPESPDATQ